jgi:hypothetical protein
MSGTRQRWSLSLLLFSTVLYIFFRAIRKERKKRHTNRKERNQTIPFSEGMVLYTENLMTPPKDYYNKFSKVEYKSSIKIW